MEKMNQKLSTAISQNETGRLKIYVWGWGLIGKKGVEGVKRVVIED